MHSNAVNRTGLIIAVSALTVVTRASLADVTPPPRTPTLEASRRLRVFTERYRPQFHYTAVKGWINDPIGLLYYAGPFHYWIGDFDGQKFPPQTRVLRCEFGKNFHAAQSWETPDKKRVQIGWMNGGVYPGMPFNQQMTFPCELTLRTTPDGVRLFMYPIEAIQSLYIKSFSLENQPLKPGDNPLADISGELFDIEMAVELGDATEFGLRLHKTTVIYSDNQVACSGAKANVSPINGVITLRILVDRTSIETFVNDGQVALPCCFLPKKLNTGLHLYAEGGHLMIRSLRVTSLKSCWE